MFRMIDKFIKNKKKNAIFICQIAENYLKVIKCLNNNARREFTGLEVEEMPPKLDEKTLSERINSVLKKLEYNNNPLIISLPRQNVTSRYLKVPARNPAEIEKIMSLQASRFLPYPNQELITGFQVILVDKEGYSHINLVITHKDTIERYIKIFAELNFKNFKIILSSYGLSGLYNYLEPQKKEPVIIIDIDLPQTEIAITCEGKLFFSRPVKLLPSQNWQNLLIEEINKTKDAYLKETGSKEVPAQIIIFGPQKNVQEASEILGLQTGLSVKPLCYWEKIPASEDFLSRILNIDNSLASLVGLGLKDAHETLNLLPPDIKAKNRKLLKNKERLRLISFIAGVILVFGIAIARNLDNKASCLRQLKNELAKIEKEAKPLEGLEKRFQLLESRLKKGPSALEILYELHQVMPNQVSLINFNYEEDSQVILRGQTPEMNYIFGLVSQLEKSPVFKNFNAKVRYATKRKIEAGEVMDFEIVCSKK